MKNAILSFAFLCLPFFIGAQSSEDCSLEEYEMLIRAANSYASKGPYQKAIRLYNAAKECQPSKNESVDQMIISLFNQINGERKTAQRALELKKEKQAILEDKERILNYLSFSDAGLAWVIKGGKSGLINKQGEQLTEFIYEGVDTFKNNVAVVKKSRRNWTFINEKGEEIGDTYARISYWKHTYYKVTMHTNDYDDDISSDSSKVQEKNALLVINNSQKKVVSEKHFEFYQDIQRAGLDYVHWAKKDKHWYLLDTLGQLINTFFCDNYRLFDIEKHEAFAQLEKKWGLVNTEGEWQIFPQYEDIKWLNDGLLAVKIDSLWGIIDKSEEWKLRPQFTDIESFGERSTYTQQQIGLYVKDDKSGRWKFLNQNFERDSNSINQNFMWCLDNGHGKLTPGKRSPLLDNGSRLFEYEINRDIVLRITKLLDAKGIKYFEVEPHPEQTDNSLKERVERVNTLESPLPKILVSVHSNFAPTKSADDWANSNISGIETWYIDDSRQGRQLANIFQKNLIEKTGWKNRHIKSRESNQFYIFRKTNCLSILTENGFLNNKEQASALAQSETRQKIAAAHVAAILQIENNPTLLNTPDLIPTDSLLAQQWYFKNDGLIEDANWKTKVGADAKIIDAWKFMGNKGSSEIIMAVIDNGFDIKHPDLSDKIVAPYDLWNQSEIISSGDPRFTHGTSTASIALATDNGEGIVGVAPNTQFMPISGTSFSLKATEQMFDYSVKNGADIILCPWGTTDSRFKLSPQKEAAIQTATQKGRDGKGAIVIFPAGNDNIDYINYYALAPNVIAVGASTSQDELASYSNRGKGLSVVAPSNGDWPMIASRASWDEGIKSETGNFKYWRDGRNRGKYYKHFGGTDGATAIVAGICALILSENPDLTAIQVKEILETTADKIGNLKEYDANGYSNKYGFGRVNALKAVKKARAMKKEDNNNAYYNN